MTRTLAALFVAAALSPAAAAPTEKIYLTDPAFQKTLTGAFQPFAAKDAFAGLAECGVLESKRRYDLVAAVAAVQSCLDGVTGRYGLSLKAEIGAVETVAAGQNPFGIVIWTGDVSVAAPVMRDLNHALEARGRELLGHSARIRRAAERQSTRQSLAQDALDACLLPTVLRKIENGDDFIKHFGSCLLKDSKLGVKELRQSPGHRFAVAAMTTADDVVVEGLNGSVWVMSESGRVEIMIVAFSEKVTLP